MRNHGPGELNASANKGNYTRQCRASGNLQRTVQMGNLYVPSVKSSVGS